MIGDEENNGYMQEEFQDAGQDDAKNFDPDFADLRETVIRNGIQKKRERIESKAPISELEYRLGALQEDIEEQVWPAIEQLNRFGYETWSSGFLGNTPFQSIEGASFNLPDEVIKEIESRGVRVGRPDPQLGGTMWTLSLRAKEAHVHTIQKQWQDIVSLFPDRGKPAYVTGEIAEQFRREHPLPPKNAE